MTWVGREETFVGRSGDDRSMASRLGRVRRVGVDERGTLTITRPENLIYACFETTRSKEPEKSLVSRKFSRGKVELNYLNLDQKLTCSQPLKNSL